MALQPSTSTQVAEKSILDLNGRQAYLGNSFILPQDGKSFSDTSEDPVLLIQNPLGSGKSLFLSVKKYTTDANDVYVRLYFNPTGVTTGDATVPVNVRTGSATTSITNCYLGPSASSNGTFITTLPATLYGLTSEVLYIVDPGTSLYATGQQGIQEFPGATNLYLEISWYEL